MFVVNIFEKTTNASVIEEPLEYASWFRYIVEEMVVESIYVKDINLVTRGKTTDNVNISVIKMMIEGAYHLHKCVVCYPFCDSIRPAQAASVAPALLCETELSMHMHKYARPHRCRAEMHLPVTRMDMIVQSAQSLNKLYPFSRSHPVCSIA